MSEGGKKTTRITSSEHLHLPHHFIDKIPDVIVCIDVNGIFRYVSKASESLWGYKPDELIGKRFIDFVAPVDRERSLHVARQMLEGLTVSRFENEYIKKDGDVIPVIWSVHWDSTDQLVYGVARNATDIRDTASMLVLKETLLNESQKLAKMGSWNFDLLTNRITWSEALYDVFDVDKENFWETYGSFLDLVDEEDREFVRNTSERCQKSGDSFNVRYTITTPAGEKRIIEEFGYSEKDATGKIVRLFGTAQNITDRVAAENELKASRERYKKVFHLGPLPMWIYNIQSFAYLDVNQMAIDTYGYSKEEFLTMTIMDIRPEENIPALEKLHWDVSYMSKSHFGVHTHRKKSGELIRMDVTGHRMNYLGYDCMIVVCVDVTENERLNAELVQRAQELEISNADLERFAYVASHDLQEPLRMIASFMALLDKKYHDKLDDKARQYIHFAVDGAKRMRQIILDLLDFSRFGGHEGERESIDLNEIIDEFKLLRRRLIKDKSALLHSDPLPVVWAHRAPITLVFHNLLDNALKYSRTSAQPKISIASSDKGDFWQFSINDNGMGIEPEYFDKIFIIFQRLQSNEFIPGSGMGLAITKRIVESYDGEIWLESKPEVGSTFYFTVRKQRAQ